MSSLILWGLYQLRTNVVSSKTEKTTTACNFQHDYVMRGQMDIFKYEGIRGFMMGEM